MEKAGTARMVSINLCCYNSEKYLRETLQSLINQTYKNWELVVINDGSSDSTEAIILEFKDRGYPIRYHYQQNAGLSASRNKAFELSKGEYVAFIDHDDLWLPDKLEKQVAMFEKHPKADFQYGNYFILKGRRKILALRREQPQGKVFARFLYHCPVAILTTMVRKRAMERLDSLFDSNLNMAEEFDLFMRLLYRSGAVYQNEPLAVYRMHSGMSSIKFMERWPAEIEYVIKKFGYMYQNFEKDYADALNNKKRELECLRAKVYMKLGDSRSARRHLRPYIFSDLKSSALYLFSGMPVRLRDFVSLHLLKSTF